MDKRYRSFFLDKVEKDIGLEPVTDFKVVNLKNMSRFMNDILPGKINNKYDAEKEYVKRIEDDEKFFKKLQKLLKKNKNAQTITIITNNLEYAMFGTLLRSELADADGMKNLDIRDMPDLKTEEEAGKRQKDQGLKIMTSSQLITRLPILLAQVKAGNNSQKLKNEIRQIVYSLYRSKNLSKAIYNHLMDNI